MNDFIFTKEAFEQYLEWQQEDKKTLKRINESSPKKCVNCSQLKMILSCRLLGHLFDDLFMIVVVGKHIEHTAACAPFIMLIDQD